MTHVHEIVLQQQLVFDEESINISEYLSKMLEYQKEYFITSDNAIKKELKRQIERIQVFMVEETLRFDKKKLKAFSEIAKKKSKPWFIWKLEFFDVFKNNGGFDIVIGNPPYVSVKGLSNDDKNAYRKKYTTGQGRFNLFTLMIENGLNILNDDGILTFIQPDGLFTNIEYRHTRELLVNNTSILKIIGFDSRVFESAAVDTAILVVTKSMKKDNVICILRNISTLTNRISQGKICKENEYMIPINMKDGESRIIDFINKNSYPVFDDLMEVQQGIIYSGTPKEEIFSNVPLNDNYKRSLDGRDVHRWYIDWESKQENRYIEYTNKLHRPREERLFLAKEKLIMPRKSTKITCGYDDKQFYVLNTGYVCLAKNEKVSIKYIMAILNSNLINYYYVKQYLGWQIVIPALKKIPICYDETRIDKVEEIVDKLINKDSSSSDLEKKLNSIIYDIYNIPSELIEEIEDFFNK